MNQTAELDDRGSFMTLIESLPKDLRTYAGSMIRAMKFASEMSTAAPAPTEKET